MHLHHLLEQLELLLLLQLLELHINVIGGLTIAKITASVNITHTYVQDMTIILTGPAAIGSPVVILQQEACGAQPDINCTYDNAGIAPTCSATSPAISGTIQTFE